MALCGGVLFPHTPHPLPPVRDHLRIPKCKELLSAEVEKATFRWPVLNFNPCELPSALQPSKLSLAGSCERLTRSTCIKPPSKRASQVAGPQRLSRRQAMSYLIACFRIGRYKDHDQIHPQHHRNHYRASLGSLISCILPLVTAPLACKAQGCASASRNYGWAWPSSFGQVSTYRFVRRSTRAGDRLPGRRPPCCLVPLTATSSRAPNVSNPVLGPCHRSSSTSSNSFMSVRSVASVRNSSARALSLESVCARALALAAFTRHSLQYAGMDSRWMNLASTAADDFAPQPGKPGSRLPHRRPAPGNRGSTTARRRIC